MVTHNKYLARLFNKNSRVEDRKVISNEEAYYPSIVCKS